jgi:hypothetical protein
MIPAAMTTGGPFYERLAARSRRWKAGRPWQGPQGFGQALHRFREVIALRTRHDPDHVWRCCDAWQRTLINKWNSREFAARHGCPVPELYWSGSSLSQAPFESQPNRFVVRGTTGDARRRVVVVADGQDVLRDEPASPAAIRQRLAQPYRPWPRVQILIEEFVTSRDGHRGLPLECKVHMFGDTIGAVQLTRRTGARKGWFRYYTPDWRPFEDEMELTLPQDDIREPPPGLPEILHFARILGRAFGDYVRIDFFAADRGCVFNEFALNPCKGRGFTPYCESMFAALWAEHGPAER